MRTTYWLNSSFIHLMIFVSVFGSRVHLLSTAAAAAVGATPAIEGGGGGLATFTTAEANENFHIDAVNKSRENLISNIGFGGDYYPSSLSSLSSFSSISATTPMRMITASASASASTSLSTATAAATAIGSAAGYASTNYETETSRSANVLSRKNNYNNNILISRTSAMPSESLSTSAPTYKNVRSTSKFPPDFMHSKQQWKTSAVKDVNSYGGSSLFLSTSSTMATKKQRIFRNKHHHDHHWGPFFEEPQLNSSATGDNLISKAHLYTEAVLNCRVGMLKDKTVMWVRRTDEKVSLLTVGNVTYSGDPRIRVKFQYPNNWRLLINPTHQEDAGIYMCQVSTHPPRVFTTNLTVLEPPLRLIDDQEREVGDRYYKSGSTIDLQCQVSRSFLIKEKQSVIASMQSTNQNQNQNVNQTKSNPFKPNMGNSPSGAGYNELVMMNGNQTNKQGTATSAQGVEKQFSSMIYWLKDDEALPASTVRRSSTNEKWLNSRISIPDAKLTDSGNYSCTIGKLYTAIVQVQVLTGELPAAVQHNHANVLQLGAFYWCFNLIIAFIVASLPNISSYTDKLFTKFLLHKHYE